MLEEKFKMKVLEVWTPNFTWASTFSVLSNITSRRVFGRWYQCQD